MRRLLQDLANLAAIISLILLLLPSWTTPIRPITAPAAPLHAQR